MMVRWTALACALSALPAQSWNTRSVDLQPGVTSGKSAFDSSRNQTVLFGGILALEPGTPPSGETWLLTADKWTRATPAASPSARVGHATTFDEARGEIVLFGGCTRQNSPSTAQADTWAWNGSTWTNRTPALSPPARCGHAVAWDPVRRQTVLFGGTSPSSSTLADTWLWDGVNWTRAATSGPVGSNAAMAWDPATGSLLSVTYGSAGQSVISSWNGAAWTALATSSEMQPLLGMIPVANGLLMFEGSAGPPGRVWWWNGSSVRRLATTAWLVPSSLQSPALSWDPVGKRPMLLGLDHTSEGTPYVTPWYFDPGSLCSIDISPLPGTIATSSRAGSAQLNISVPAGCPWNKVSPDDWITVTPFAGTGPTTVSLAWDANPGPVGRSGTVTFSGGIEYWITQDQPPCPSAGTPLPASPFVLRHECPATFTWNATAGQQFALRSIVTAGGGNTSAITPLFTISGPAAPQAVLASNSFGGTQDPVALLPSTGLFTAPVTGAYTVRLAWSSTAGASLIDWMQTGSSCTPTMQQYSTAGVPASGVALTLPASGPADSWISVGLAPSCAPVAVFSTQHTASTATAAPGYTKVSLTLSTNYSTFPRSSFLDAGSTHLLLIQAPNSCSYRVTPATVPLPDANRTSLTFQLTATGTDCRWSVSASTPWIQLYPLSGTGSATIRGTVYPNFGTNTRHATITVANTGYNITQVGVSPLESNSMDRYVRLIYFSFFGRIPTAAEVAFHANSRQSREQLALNFLNSEEFNRAGRFVAGLYVGLLNRDAEYGGWLFQRDALATGLTNEVTVVDNFLNSPEFQLKFGSLSNREFVALLYRQVLLREPGQSEIDFQAGALSGITRTQLARNFLWSTEFRLGTGPRLTAFLAWACLLGRDPTFTEFTADITKLQQILAIGDSGARTDAIRDRVLGPIANSPEMNGIIQ